MVKAPRDGVFLLFGADFSEIVRKWLDSVCISVYTVYMGSIQYTIRNIPEPVNRVLRQRAKRTGKSFNQVLVEALEQAVGMVYKPKKVKHIDLDWFIGGNSLDKEEFEKSMEWLDSLPNDLEDNFKYS